MEYIYFKLSGSVLSAITFERFVLFCTVCLNYIHERFNFVLEWDDADGKMDCKQLICLRRLIT